MLAQIVAARLDLNFPGQDLSSAPEPLAGADPDRCARRDTYALLLLGLPAQHVDQGARRQPGTGGHRLPLHGQLDGSRTTSLIQMGGEGVNWVSRSKFNGNRHIFQNLGEGTYYHSGSLAIRQAIAAGTNITYKILFNDAVAMTGGQPVDGPIASSRSPQSPCRRCKEARRGV